MKIKFLSPQQPTRFESAVYPESAFSLLEILITMSVLAVLAALLFPMASRSLESARSAKCIGNLKQISAAAAQYSADNDGKLVPKYTGNSGDLSSVKTFRAYLNPYLGDDPKMKVFVCPSDTWAKKQVIAPSLVNVGIQPTSYAINGAYFNFINGMTLPYPGYHDFGLDLTGKKQPSVPHPASTIFLCDMGRPDSVNVPLQQWTEKNRALSNANFGYAKMPVSGANSWGAGQDCIYPRHAGARVNVAFYDGHVATLDLAKDVVAHPPGDPDCLYDYH